jgi:tungstate transport system substrate-binding protein
MVRHICAGLVALLTAVGAAEATSVKPFIVVASTTSTDNSGLFAHLLPMFTAESGIEVRVVARGTGQAIRMAESGDADVLLVHHRASEERFVAQGHGVARRDVMYNDFVILGPSDDPAGIAGRAEAAAALTGIARSGATFLSRGDDSGTHKKELELWRAAGIDPSQASGRWYRETGAGMGATLNTASALDAYLLSDRATWLAFRNKGALKVLAEGDPSLRNPYGVILVNPARHPHVKADQGQAFIDWLVGPQGQGAIGAFRIEGRQAFFPNATPGS